MRLLAIMRLGSVKARDKLVPLLRSSCVEHVTLVRHTPVDIDSPRLRQDIHRSSLDQGVAAPRFCASAHNLLQCLYRGVRAVRRDRLDAVVAFNFVPYGVVAYVVARLTGRRVIVSLIGADFNTYLWTRPWGAPLRAVLRRCDRVAIFGEQARQVLLDLGLRDDQVFVLPNTADTDRYHPDPQTEPAYDLICTGYLIPRKQVDRLLEALALVRRRRPHTTLLIVGDGVERGRLEALAGHLEVSEMVTFEGWSDQVAELLRRARVFVLLSQAEGLPIAMLEAMCSGLPVVVTDVGANATVIDDGVNGYLVPASADPEVVADRILRLLEDPAHLQEAGEAALRVRETHGYSATADVWDTVITKFRE